MWYVYILKCKDKSFYTGITSDLKRRLKEHNSGNGGRYTRTRYPVKMVYTEELPDRSAALKRECQVKNMPRLKKKLLVKGGAVAR